MNRKIRNRRVTRYKTITLRYAGLPKITNIDFNTMRVEANLTQQDLANFIGTQKIRITNFEKGTEILSEELYRKTLNLFASVHRAQQ
jgi:DNA-binding XRE family transcriptional regulator